ncbi:FAD-dependent oxidoreductase, partial [Armatimonas sp.]|uniref:FAD-dependent oxidoreductase n=1 Tax=Armatimonas sp. TaxID=1872638 RepID=UPI0037526CBC
MKQDYPLAFETDVCVVGGGPTGVAAALSAARNGASVLLIERMGFLGGSATAMQVPAFAPFSDRTKAIVRGIGWEVMTEHQRRLGHRLPHPDSYHKPQDNGRMDWVPIDVELLKRLYDELCDAAGVTVLFHTFVPAVQQNTERLEAIVLANKAGLSVAKASVFIDATGDGDLAARAG